MILEEPKIPEQEEWPDIVKLEKEKEVTGIYLSGHPLDNYKLELEHYIDMPLDQIDRKNPSTIHVAGLITQAFHGITRNRGLGYARFTIQDYTGSFDVGLYRETYMKFKDFIKNGQVVYVVGKHVTNKDNDNSFFKVKEVKMLDTLTEELTKSITIRMHLKELTEEFIHQLEEVCLNKDGKHALKLRIVDKEDDLKMDFISKEFKVTATSDFIESIKAQGLSYKLN
jgi:DNA polymerase-3 subunit alpha